MAPPVGTDKAAQTHYDYSIGVCSEEPVESQDALSGTDATATNASEESSPVEQPTPDLKAAAQQLAAIEKKKNKPSPSSEGQTCGKDGVIPDDELPKLHEIMVDRQRWLAQNDSAGAHKRIPDGVQTKYALIINGDTEERHLANVDRAIEALKAEDSSYDISVASPKGPKDPGGHPKPASRGHFKTGHSDRPFSGLI